MTRKKSHVIFLCYRKSEEGSWNWVKVFVGSRSPTTFLPRAQLNVLIVPTSYQEKEIKSKNVSLYILLLTVLLFSTTIYTVEYLYL